MHEYAGLQPCSVHAWMAVSTTVRRCCLSGFTSSGASGFSGSPDPMADVTMAEKRWSKPFASHSRAHCCTCRFKIKQAQVLEPAFSVPATSQKLSRPFVSHSSTHRCILFEFKVEACSAGIVIGIQRAYSIPSSRDCSLGTGQQTM